MESPKGVDLYSTFRPVARGVLALQYKLDVSGAEHAPEAPALYVANHERFVDSPLIALAVQSIHTHMKVRFGAKSEYFEGKGINDDGKLGRTMKFLIERTGQISVDRRGYSPASFDRLFKQVQSRLQAGDSVAFHGEGTRTAPGELQPFKTGAARLALMLVNEQLPTPLVPTAITYHQSRKRHQRTRAQVAFGEPILPSEFYEYAPESASEPDFNKRSRQRSKAITEELEQRVAGLLNISHDIS